MTESLASDALLVRALLDLEVKHIFWHPGGASFPFYQALSESKEITSVLARHGVGACHMAEGYARTTGAPGVVMLTSGSGASNSITGIANAYMDSIPLIVICGRDTPNVTVADQFDETDLIGVSRPVVKHSYVVWDAEEIPRVLQEALYIATSGRPGPVVIDIPNSKCDSTTASDYIMPKLIAPRGYRPAESGHFGQIRKALEAILQSSRPVIYAGGGVIQGNAAVELRALAERLRLPVTTSLMGLGAIPGEHELCLGMLGVYGSFVANNATAHADLILALGTRFDDWVVNEQTRFSPQARVIHVDIDPSSISKVITAHLPVVGPCKAVVGRLHDLALEHLNDLELPINHYDDWWDQLRSWHQAVKQNEANLAASNEGSSLTPQEVVHALFEATQGHAFITTDVGQHQMFVAQGYAFDSPRRWVTPGGLGTMGFGLPAALGVQIAHPEATVVCVTGESSLLVNLQELSTCRQYQLPVKILCLNNGTLGMVKQWNQVHGGGCELKGYRESLPDFVQLVESFGHRALNASSPRELQEAIMVAFSEECQSETVFINVRVDPNVLLCQSQRYDSTMAKPVLDEPNK